MKTYVYVDGFNLYYGAVRHSNYKWLDLGKLLKFLLPGDSVEVVKYFTAPVVPPPDDPSMDARQQTYLRALRMVPNLTVYYGHFLTSVTKMAKAPLTNPPVLVDVVKTEEKGSDVNIASHLLIDCFDDRFEQAVVVSADSDLEFPMRTVKERYGKRVIALFPYRHDSAKLRQAVDEHRIIREGALRVCQFPNPLRDSVGQIHKPFGW